MRAAQNHTYADARSWQRAILPALRLQHQPNPCVIPIFSPIEVLVLIPAALV
jgi:hypothetical protein